MQDMSPNQSHLREATVSSTGIGAIYRSQFWTTLRYLYYDDTNVDEQLIINYQEGFYVLIIFHSVISLVFPLFSFLLLKVSYSSGVS